MKKEAAHTGSKKEKRMKWAVRIFTLFLVAVLLAGTFYYTIVFLLAAL